MVRAIIAVLGTKKSGKTRVITYLTQFLKQRYKILCIKHSCEPNFDIDIPGKDSWRMKEAGADTVVITSDKKTAIISDSGKIDPIRIIDYLEALLNIRYDIVFIEGFSRILLYDDKAVSYTHLTLPTTERV